MNNFTNSPLLTMAYSKAKADAIITSLEKPINDRLLKLLCVGGHTTAHWRAELAEWVDEIAEIRLKPKNRPAVEAFYYRILFEEPFGGVEVTNMQARLYRLSRNGCDVRSGIEIGRVVGAVRDFTRVLARECAAGKLTLDTISTMVKRVQPLPANQ